MNKFLSQIITALIFICIISASLVLAIIGFLIFWYILIFAVALGAIIYLYMWIKYKITGKKSSYMNFQEAMRNAKKQAHHTKSKTRTTHQKRTDHSKPDNPNKETIDQEDINDKK
jgi:amino acid permease